MNRLLLYILSTLIVLTGLLLSAKVVNAAPTASDTKVLLPIVALFRQHTDNRREPITEQECTAIGGLLTNQSYANGTSFVAIDKQRRYIPRATEGMNANFFPGGTIDSRTGSSPVCYFPGNYMTMWPNPNEPVADEDLQWFVDHAEEVVYLEFPGGRPEVDDPELSASGQQTQTLYAMLIAPAVGALDDIPVIGHLKIGSQANKRLLQIGQIGNGRLSGLVRRAGHAYTFLTFVDQIWTSSTLGATMGAADLGGGAYYIPKSQVNLTDYVYIWYYENVIDEYDRWPIGEGVGILLPEGNENWGWMITKIPQFEDQRSRFRFDNILNFGTVELLEEGQPTDTTVESLEDQLAELNELANRRLLKVPQPVPGPGHACGPQDGGKIIEESVAWIAMFTSIEGNTQLNANAVRFLFEYVSNVTEMIFETRYKSLTRNPGDQGQEYTVNRINGKYWAVYSICSVKGGLAQQAEFIFAPVGAGFWGVSNNIDNPQDHFQYEFTR